MGSKSKGKQAVYTSTFNPAWKGNPYIEALKPIPDFNETYEAFLRVPPVPKGLDKMSKDQRKYLVSNLKMCFYPLNRHFELMESVQELVRSGYMGRNPICGEDLKRIRAYEAKPLTSNTASSLTVLGVSGTGKSTSVRLALEYFDQVIIHSCYKGIPLVRKQLVWLEVQCPYHESIEGFCRLVLSAFDDALGTDYFNSYSSCSVTKMLVNIKKLIEIYGLGVIFVDELQHLVGTDNNSEDLNNVLTTFSNMAKVPLIVVGTPKASPIFEKTLRTTRRYISEGSLFWDRVTSASDPFWEEWISWLFGFQYTKNHTDLTPDIVKLFYEKSQGIFDIACTLFRKVQFFIIGNPNDKEEVITEKIINKVFDFYFKPIEPILRAISHNDFRRMEELEDLLYDIDFKREYNFSYQRFDSNVQNKGDVVLGGSTNNIENELYLYFIEQDLMLDNQEIKGLIHKVLQESPKLSLKDAKVIVHEEILQFMNQKSLRQKDSPIEFISTDYLSDDDEY